jgi:hypothetical protein
MAESQRAFAGMSDKLEPRKKQEITVPAEDAIVHGFDRAPFPHVVIDNFVPEDRYQELEATFPSHSLFINHKNGKSILTDEYEVSAPTFWKFLDETPPWKSFIESIRTRAFVNRVYDAFPVFDAGKVKRVRFQFSRLRFNGGEVRPHIDTPKKIVPIVLYMPLADWTAKTGGALEFLRFKDGHNVPLDGYQAVPWEKTETVAAPAYVRNRAAVMMKNHISLHGVRPIPRDAAADRTSVTITLSYY